MDEIKPVNKDLEETLKLLENCKEKVWKRMEKLIYQCMEQTPDVTVDDQMNAGYMSLIAVECLIELARSGIDLLSQVNDKDGATLTITEF